jgi:hypothetical protein
VTRVLVLLLLQGSKRRIWGTNHCDKQWDGVLIIFLLRSLFSSFSFLAKLRAR